MTLALTISEKTQLTQAEQIIDRNLNGFIEVSQAFLLIRENKLYRDNPLTPTFSDYCRVRWGFSLSTGNQLLKSGEVLANLHSQGITDMPENQAQTFALGTLPTAEAQAVVWADLQKSDGQVTAKKIKETAQEYLITNNAPNWVFRAFKDDMITRAQGVRLYQTYMRLPEAIRDICDAYGYEGDVVITFKTMLALNNLLSENIDAIEEILVTRGYLTLGNGSQKFIGNIQSTEIEDLMDHHRLMTRFESKSQKNQALLAAISGRDTQALIINGSQELQMMNGELDSASVACIFPTDQIDADFLKKHLSDHGFEVAFIVATRNEPVLNLDGVKGTVNMLWQRINKPSWLTNMLGAMIW